MKSKYTSAWFLCGGDVKDLKVGELLRVTSNLKQIVTKPTRKSKILSVIVTDLHEYYKEPVILPPVLPDIEGTCMPSDHSNPLALPYTDTSQPRLQSYKYINVRPTPDSSIRSFGSWISSEPFHNINESQDPTVNVENFNNIVN